MLWSIVVFLGIHSLLGFSLHVGGALVHLLQVIALLAVVLKVAGA